MPDAGRVFVVRPSTSVVRMRGRESVDLLQRISTNDMLPVNAGKQVQTILTNEKGRMVDVVSAIPETADSVLLLGGNPAPMTLKTWLEKFIIMEDIKVDDESINYVEIVLADVNNDIELSTSPESAFLSSRYLDRRNVLRAICREEKSADLVGVIKARGFSEGDVAFLESFRVSFQIPKFPNELSAEVNPLEAGLYSLINWTKGCYVGQEVIARLDTYKKVQRALVGFQLTGMPSRLPVKLEHEGEDAGILTSATIGLGGSELLGLGYLRLSYLSEPAIMLTGRAPDEFSGKPINRIAT